MKRILVISVSLFLVPFLAGAKVRETDRERDGFAGLVETVMIQNALISNQSGKWVEGRRATSSLQRYNRMGDRIELTQNGRSGLPFSKEVQTQDSKGKKSIERSAQLKDGSKIKVLYSYDAGGKAIEGIEYKADGSISWKETYTYDDHGQKKQDIRRDADGLLKSRTTYTLNEKGNKVIQGTYYHVNGSVQSQWVQTYGDNEKLIEATDIAADGSTNRSIFTYEKNRTSEFRYGSDGSLKVESVRIYNDEGNLIQTEESHLRGGTTESKRINLYDTNGNILEFVRYDANQSVNEKLVYSYEFDSSGNWIKKTAYRWSPFLERESPEPFQVTYRVITYY